MEEEKSRNTSHDGLRLDKKTLKITLKLTNTLSILLSNVVGYALQRGRVFRP